MDNYEFGWNLKKIRLEKGFTQKQLADAIMVYHQSVSKWESGEAMPQVKWLYRIADALCVNPKELV
jgi:transcriptional regulator with XRE-family HTH domain